MSENPPAFPYPEQRAPDGCGIREGSDGMTLRDWFAGQALMTLISMNFTDPGGYALPATDARSARARVAYKYADAMLAERAKGRPL